MLLRITDTSDNNRDVEYNQYRLFATYVPGDPAAVTHNCNAELTKHPSQSLVNGPFSKLPVIEINGRAGVFTLLARLFNIITSAYAIISTCDSVLMPLSSTVTHRIGSL